ncbi:MAG: zinc-ribbon domain-containing protein [Saccharofermentans sp.]|nr:zinc-ribbon domain-containing protein [Saccharofermentans sp.]
MAFCSNCGSPISPDSKFCRECGAANVDTPTPNGERVQEFVGKITKCPNCGEVLKALTAKCPACGFELREVGYTSSVKEFSDTLAKTVSIRQKIDLIKNFPIPNAKADIFEFLVLATTNFDTKKHLDAYGAEKDISEAWLSKIEQAYVKAEILFKNDKDFNQFEELYNSDILELRAAEANKANAKHYFYGSIMMLMAALVFVILMLKGSGITANPRLDVTVLAFFVNGIISYVYARKQDLKVVAFIVYCANAVLNLAFCLVAPGHLFHVLIIVACGLGAFLEKKKAS